MALAGEVNKSPNTPFLELRSTDSRPRQSFRRRTPGPTREGILLGPWSTAARPNQTRVR